MRAGAAFIALLLLAPFAAAQETPAPDYSRDTLLRLFANAGEDEDFDARGVRYRLGSVSFRALGTSWRFNYLPVMVPFSGSGPGFNGAITNTLPDPFMLTNTGIATSPRAWRTQRERNAELRRIERTERARIKVDVK
jgi:hypothetical protein